MARHYAKARYHGLGNLFCAIAPARSRDRGRGRTRQAIADVLSEVREASGVVGQPGMHVAELIDQDGHSEDDKPR